MIIGAVLVETTGTATGKETVQQIGSYVVRVVKAQSIILDSMMQGWLGQSLQVFVYGVISLARPLQKLEDVRVALRGLGPGSMS
jgi:hypothetical protein